MYHLTTWKLQTANGWGRLSGWASVILFQFLCLAFCFYRNQKLSILLASFYLGLSWVCLWIVGVTTDQAVGITAHVVVMPVIRCTLPWHRNCAQTHTHTQTHPTRYREWEEIFVVSNYRILLRATLRVHRISNKQRRVDVAHRYIVAQTKLGIAYIDSNFMHLVYT